MEDILHRTGVYRFALLSYCLALHGGVWGVPQHLVPSSVPCYGSLVHGWSIGGLLGFFESIFFCLG